MEDKFNSLVWSMSETPGLFALLIGSGVSTGAGIPTSWDITVDMIRKLAQMEGQEVIKDPQDWYFGQYNETPSYSKLIKKIAPMSSESTLLLKRYFEPREDDALKGIKVPSVAHKEIANLVSKGYCRVIITTNFDRLTERAIEDVGIDPTVIKSADDVEGALPIRLSKCTIIKVSGDYLDTRIKNSEDELSHYPEKIIRLLNVVFYDFGLIVCGWSAEWDIALKDRILQNVPFRFPVYWTLRSDKNTAIAELIEKVGAAVIKIESADSFFSELSKKIAVMVKSPISENDELKEMKERVGSTETVEAKPIEIAPTTEHNSKGELIGLLQNNNEIAVERLISQITEGVYKQLGEENFPLKGEDIRLTGDAFQARMAKYEEIIQELLILIANGCFYGDSNFNHIWIKSLKRIANPPEDKGGFTRLINLRYYPGLVLSYAGGVMAIYRDKYSTFRQLIEDVKIRYRDNRRMEAPLAEMLSTFAIIPKDITDQIKGMERQYTPLSNHLFDLLRERIRDLIPDDFEFETAFDKYEYFFALVQTEYFQNSQSPRKGQPGRFAWNIRYHPETNIVRQIEMESAAAGNNWPPLRSGLFEGDPEKFKSIKSIYDEFLLGLAWF